MEGKRGCLNWEAHLSSCAGNTRGVFERESKSEAEKINGSGCIVVSLKLHKCLGSPGCHHSFYRPKI